MKYAFLCAAVVVLSCSFAMGQAQYQVLWSFAGGANDGFEPVGNLVFDSVSNLYGTTSFGGPSNLGTVFELSPAPAGAWTEAIIFNFDSEDGGFPLAGLIFDTQGNLYSTTAEGGAGDGTGTVFMLTPSGETWEHAFLSFNSLEHGFYSTAPVVFDGVGNLYGTTSFGGLMCHEFTSGCGTLFELSRDNVGTVHKTDLHRFTGGRDGAIPESGLTMDAAGDVFGTTNGGGQTGGLCSNIGPTGGCGVVFKMTPAHDGELKGSLVWTFTGGADGAFPAYGNLILDAAGNLYGTASGGGYQVGPCAEFGCGVVYELTPISGGWRQTTLYTFMGPDGEEPTGGLIFDSAGNLVYRQERWRRTRGWSR